MNIQEEIYRLEKARDQLEVTREELDKLETLRAEVDDIISELRNKHLHTNNGE